MTEELNERKQPSTKTSSFLDIFALALDKIKSDSYVLFVISILGFLILTIFLLKFMPSDFGVVGISIIAVLYIIVVFSCFYYADKASHHVGDGLLKISDIGLLQKEIVELRRAVSETDNQLSKIKIEIMESSRATDRLSASLSGNLMFFDLTSKGRIDISEISQLMRYWVFLTNRSSKSFFALNYLSKDIILSDSFGKGYGLLEERKHLSSLHIKRIFLVDDLDEARQIRKIIEKHQSENIDAGYVVLSDVKRKFTECGFSPDDWNEGFVIMDDTTVAKFEMDKHDRTPKWLSIINHQDEVKNYKSLYESLSSDLKRNL